ncbi:MAG: efflux RND transporter periplasmic adaptor subunit [Bacteroidales bacterium]|nr:efflux RND transporter periplasmic adaptor subunit [Bacteroidales bacterium]
MSKKKIIIVLSLIVVAGILVWIFSSSKEESKVEFFKTKAVRGEIGSSITATGTIEPVTEVEVGTQVSGIIDRIYVDYNSVVKRGQLIAEMDKITLQSELQSARAQYDGNKAEYDYQKKLYDRNQILHEKELISETDYELSSYNYQRAKSAYEQSSAALAKAERNLSYATITSPIDGIVTSRSVEEGQTVASGFETPTLFTIAADLTKMQVVADVDEADIANVKEGDYVVFTVDAYPEDEFIGTVRQVRLGSTISNTTSTTTANTVVTYEVVISAENPELKLKPRLTANASIYTTFKADVLKVPSKALHFAPNAQLAEGYTIVDCEAPKKVWTLDGKTFTAHPVETGLSDGVDTEILSGIEEGTEVVTEMSLTMFNIPQQGAERSPFMPQHPGSKKKTTQKK